MMDFVPSLVERRIQPEILDTLPAEAARASLADLVRINRDFGGHSALGHALDDAVSRYDNFSLLDVGAASGDMGRTVHNTHPGARVTALDHVACHLELADHPKLAGDAFQLPFRDAAFDIVFSSLFLHHFEAGAIVRLFAEMRRVARHSVVAVDLERHPLAYYFLPATQWLFRWDAVTVHDGPISVAAGFKPKELEELAAQAGLQHIKVRRHGLSFRLTMAGRA